MPKRSYKQYCAIAYALDVVGERWTLLIVRELLTGPKRFTDLLNNLRGLGTNLLSARLKEMEETGILERRTLPPPAASSVYELTELGAELEPVIRALHRWGGLTMEAEPQAGDYFRPGWAVLAMKYVFNPDAAKGLHETYEYRIDGDVFHSRIDDGEIETQQGPAQSPDLVISTDADTFYTLASAQLSFAEAVASGAVRFEGNAETLRHSAEVFGLPV